MHAELVPSQLLWRMQKMKRTWLQMNQQKTPLKKETKFGQLDLCPSQSTPGQHPWCHSAWLNLSLNPRTMRNTFPHICASSTQSSPRNPLTTCQNPNHRIMLMNLYQMPQIPRVARFTHSQSQSKRNLMHSSRRTSILARSDLPNPQWLHWSSLSRRSVAACDLYRITDHST